METSLTVSGTTSLQYQYVWSPRYIDAPILRDDFTASPARIYYLDDANFNVTTLTGTDGGVLERVVYSAYGAPTFYNSAWTSPGSATSSYSNSIIFTGREFDAETGLYYYRARYYSPGLGRFLSRDPIELGGGIDVYNLDDDSPFSGTDPFGLATIHNRLGREFTDADLDDLVRRYRARHPSNSPCVQMTLDEFYRRLPGDVQITDQMQWSLAWGCIGLASWLQNQSNPAVVDKQWKQHPRLDPPPENTPENYGNSGTNGTNHTRCYLSAHDAAAFRRTLVDRGITSFVFGRQGYWKNRTKPAVIVSAGPENGAVPNDSVESHSGHENYVSVYGNYYVWMNNWRISPSPRPDTIPFQPDPSQPEVSGRNKQFVTICLRRGYPLSRFNNMPATIWCVSWCEDAVVYLPK